MTGKYIFVHINAGAAHRKEKWDNRPGLLLLKWVPKLPLK